MYEAGCQNERERGGLNETETGPPGIDRDFLLSAASSDGARCRVVRWLRPLSLFPFSASIFFFALLPLLLLLGAACLFPGLLSALPPVLESLPRVSLSLSPCRSPLVVDCPARNTLRGPAGGFFSFPFLAADVGGPVVSQACPAVSTIIARTRVV